MSLLKNAFPFLQKIGKCMMLPVSVLPVAGILLGVGSANFSWLPQSVSQVMAASGNAIFANLPLLFAIGVAIGLTDNDGVAAMAGTVGYVVFLAAMGICAKLRGIETATIMGIPSIETGVFGGIIVGLVAAWAFNRFYKIKLPAYLGFFAGFLLYIGASDILPEAHREGSSGMTIALTVLGTVFAFGVTRFA